MKPERESRVCVLVTVVLFLCHASGANKLASTLKPLPRSCGDLTSCTSSQKRFPTLIDPDGEGGLDPFTVECDLTTYPPFTVIGHNFPLKTEVVKAKNHPDGNYYPVTYADITMKQIEALMEIEGRCSQHLKYDCHHSVLTYKGESWSFWFSRDGKRMGYFPGGPTDGYGCACGIDKSCAGGANQVCNCEKNDEVWRSDEGSITDKSLLPITKLYFTDTDLDSPKERGLFTLGPLQCKGSPENNFDVHFCEKMKHKGRDFWMIESIFGSVWPDHGHCIAISRTDPETSGDYDLSVDLMAAQGYDAATGHAGVLFNVQNELNYDFLWVTSHSVTACYTSGFVHNGKVNLKAKGVCPNGRPLKHVWLTLKVEVRRSGPSNVRLNNLSLADFKPYFPERRLGGALTINGRRDLIAFKNYRLTPING